MADNELNIVINVKNDQTKKLDATAQSVDKVGRTARGAKEQVSMFGTSVNKLGTSLMNYAMAYASFAGGRRALELFADSVKSAAMFDRSLAVANNTINITSDQLKSLANIAKNSILLTDMAPQESLDRMQDFARYGWAMAEAEKGVAYAHMLAESTAGTDATATKALTDAFHYFNKGADEVKTTASQLQWAVKEGMFKNFDELGSMLDKTAYAGKRMNTTWEDMLVVTSQFRKGLRDPEDALLAWRKFSNVMAKNTFSDTETNAIFSLGFSPQNMAKEFGDYTKFLDRLVSSQKPIAVVSRALQDLFGERAGGGIATIVAVARESGKSFSAMEKDIAPMGAAIRGHMINPIEDMTERLHELGAEWARLKLLIGERTTPIAETGVGIVGTIIKDQTYALKNNYLYTLGKLLMEVNPLDVFKASMPAINRIGSAFPGPFGHDVAPQTTTGFLPRNRQAEVGSGNSNVNVLITGPVIAKSLDASDMLGPKNGRGK